jgi:hypothetical protein
MDHDSNSSGHTEIQDLTLVSLYYHYSASGRKVYERKK